MDEYIRPNRLIGKLHVGYKLTASEEAELYWYIKYLEKKALYLQACFDCLAKITECER